MCFWLEFLEFSHFVEIMNVINLLQQLFVFSITMCSYFGDFPLIGILSVRSCLVTIEVKSFKENADKFFAPLILILVQDTAITKCFT